MNLFIITDDIRQTPLLVFMNLMIILVFYITTNKSLVYPYKISQHKRCFAILLLFVFVVFAFWGTDWFHYLEIYPTLLDGYSGIHMEGVYVWIAQNLSVGYLSFRLAIWGAALCLFFFTIKRLSINRDIALCLFGAFALIWFSYARVSLAMVMAYYGVTLLYKPYRFRFLSKLLGVSFMLCSLFFHKSAAFALFVALLAYMAEKINRKLFITLVICVIPVLVLVMKSFLSDFMQMDSAGGETMLGQVVATGQGYMNADQGQISGPGAMLERCLERMPYYFIAWYSIKVQRKKIFKRIPKDMVFFIRFQFLIVLIASVFLMDFGLNTSTLYDRFLRFAAIPSVIVLSYFWEHRIFPKLTKWTFRIAFAGTLYAITYSLYNASVAT